MLYSLAFILLSGIIIQLLCKKLNITSLIGFILVGILLGPAVLNVLDPTLLNISADIRQIVLIIILTRAGVVSFIPGFAGAVYLSLLYTGK